MWKCTKLLIHEDAQNLSIKELSQINCNKCLRRWSLEQKDKLCKPHNKLVYVIFNNNKSYIWFLLLKVLVGFTKIMKNKSFAKKFKA